MALSLAEPVSGDDAWSLSDAELCDRYVEQEREITRLQAEQAATLAVVDRRQAYQPEYLTSAAFVRHRTGVAGSEARRRVTEARRLAEHDAVREAFASAAIDSPRMAMLLHAAALAPDLFERDESVLIEAVAGLPMGDANRAIDYWRQAVDRRGFARDADHARERRGLSSRSGASRSG
jgi:hypothetical protein